MLLLTGIIGADGTIDTHRFFNSDDTPQFINYGHTPRTARAVGVKGQPPRHQALHERERESVTVVPLIGLDGTCYLLQIIAALRQRALVRTRACFSARAAATCRIEQVH